MQFNKFFFKNIHTHVPGITVQYIYSIGSNIGERVSEREICGTSTVILLTAVKDGKNVTPVHIYSTFGLLL